MNKSGNTKHVLWTGGWDSTYRILDLLHGTNCAVLPYYLIYLGRKSTLIELRTINTMMDRLAQFRGRLLNPIIRLADRYKYATEPYAGQLKKILETHRIGTQYLCLAQFRDEQQRTDIELCAEKHGGAWNYIHPFMSHNDEGIFTVSPQAPKEMQGLLGGFHYPLFDMTKLDMEESAQSGGFRELLELSWFCHEPVGDEPCGTCPPCQSTIKMGLKRRIGEKGLRRYQQLDNKLP